VRRLPGLRVAGAFNGFELAVRAVLGQQVSTSAARTLAARLVTAHGEPVADPAGGLTHLFPDPATLASLDPEQLAMPRSRRLTLTSLIAALAGGELEMSVGSDWGQARAELAALPGFGPWTIETIAMRGLGDPDAFIPTDLGIRRAAEALGLPTSPAGLTKRSTEWSPWRAYAVQYLWSTGEHPINYLPG
jgi:AraC family transcriptional regulator, regulatory protein of adaptative response / DNA-3-methyladenine glycosylase II